MLEFREQNLNSNRIRALQLLSLPLPSSLPVQSIASFSHEQATSTLCCYRVKQNQNPYNLNPNQP